MDPLYAGCVLLRNSVAYYAMYVLGYYGHALVGIPVAVGLIALGYKRQNHHYKQAGFAVLVSIASAGLLTEILKHIFQMPRPRSYGSYGFPSGHSGTAFALASSLSVSFPAFTPLFFLLATCTGISRLYFRAHFLIDVFVGAMLGALTGYFITCKFVSREKTFASSVMRTGGWFSVGAVALAGFAFFYVIETQVRSYKVVDTANQAGVAGTTSFDFGTPEVRKILGSGWSLDEYWQDTKQSVVWAEGTRSEMTAVFPSAAAYRWRLNLFPYTGRGPACQVIEVQVNKTSVVKMLLEQGWHWYEFDVPSGVIQNGNNQVEFRFNYSDSPKSQSRSTDTRRLSVAFDMLEAAPQS